MLTYLELTEVKNELERRGVKYQEGRVNGAIFVYVNGLMQINKPTKKQQKQFWPEVRISLHEGDYGYYVKECGMTHENQSIEKVMKYVEKWALA